jgi:hypothetical protein
MTSCPIARRGIVVDAMVVVRLPDLQQPDK